MLQFCPAILVLLQFLFFVRNVPKDIVTHQPTTAFPPKPNTNVRIHGLLICRCSLELTDCSYHPMFQQFVSSILPTTISRILTTLERTLEKDVMILICRLRLISCISPSVQHAQLNNTIGRQSPFKSHNSTASI